MHNVISKGQFCVLRDIKILTAGWELLCHVSKLYEQMTPSVLKLEKKIRFRMKEKRCDLVLELLCAL